MPCLPEVLAQTLADIQLAKCDEMVDPTVCDHPTIHMKRRSNRRWDEKAKKMVGDDWWTCVKCLSRWKRSSYEPPRQEETDTKPETWAAPEEWVEQMGGQLLHFGKHRGKTYLWTWNHDPSYIEWISTTGESEESSPQLQAFATWILQMQLLMTERSAQEDYKEEEPYGFKMEEDELTEEEFGLL